jgi:hypothetical protein
MSSRDAAVAATSAEQAVSKRVLEQYEAFVLRPESTGPALVAAMESAIAAARVDFFRTVARAHMDALPTLEEEESSSSSPSQHNKIEVEVDWAGCARRAAGIEVGEKGVSSAAVLSVAGAKFAGGAVMNKASAVALGSAGSSAVQAAASKSLATKISGPFVAKVVSSLGASATAATAAAAAGPGAMAAGAAVGLAADVALAKAVELVRREELETDTSAAFELTVEEWIEDLNTEQEAAIGVWTADAIQLTRARQIERRNTARQGT